MEWPEQSLDPEPIESVWGDIKNAVSEMKPRNAEELWNVVQMVLDQKTCSQVPEAGRRHEHRCEAVLRNRGYTARY